MTLSKNSTVYMGVFGVGPSSSWMFLCRYLTLRITTEIEGMGKNDTLRGSMKKINVCILFVRIDKVRFKGLVKRI